jgi:D-alanyl-D-alanine carboxypeptidase
MLNAAQDAGYGYWIASAYRSRERQQELIDEDVAALMKKGYSYAKSLAETLMDTMPAGYSEHETGLALDILCSGNMNMDVSQADEAGNQWLVDHAAEYGFILRYPAEKVSVTEIEYEPWHFRYVGKEAAKYITENGLTLEEFWDIM